MLLQGTDPRLGATERDRALAQPAGRGRSVCLFGGAAEPVVSADALISAIDHNPEPFRALTPCGYAAGVSAYQAAAARLKPSDLTNHYTDGLAFFHDDLVPHLKRSLGALSGGVWQLDDFVGFAAGSDVDLMAHIVNAVTARGGDVSLYEGDWYGFLLGASQPERLRWWSPDAVPPRSALACVCVPSVRNGHTTQEMLAHLGTADAALLNINLFPTLSPDERAVTAQALLPVLQKSVISVSFSRGFGLTASQLGVVLIHRAHPLLGLIRKQLDWFTYFYNAIAAHAFTLLDPDQLAVVDTSRRSEVQQWLQNRDLPALESGSYYVKSFGLPQNTPAAARDLLKPLLRGDSLVRLCFKPTAS